MITRNNYIEVIRNLFNEKKVSGFTNEQIAKAEMQLGITLPVVLKEYYMQLGANNIINQTQNSLYNPSELKIVNSHLIFYVENQYCCVWAIKLCDLEKEDPAIYVNWDEHTSDWLLENETLSGFLTAMAYIHAQFALEYITEEFSWIKDSEAAIIKNNFKKLDIGFYHWIDSRFYSNHPDSLVVLDESCGYISYGSSNKEHFLEMDILLGDLGK